MRSASLLYSIVLALLFCCTHTFAQNSNQWDGIIRNRQSEIRQEEGNLARLENELHSLKSRREELIRKGYTYEYEDVFGGNPLVSIDREIYVINSSIESCKANINRLRNSINDARDKQRRLNDEIERRVKMAELQAKKRQTEAVKNKKNADANKRKAEQAAQIAEQQAKKEKDMEERRERERLKREADEQRRKAAGDKAAAEAEAKGAIKILKRRDKQSEAQAILRRNIASSNANDMMTDQRNRIGGNFTAARLSSTKTAGQNNKVPGMSKLLDNVKSKGVKQVDNTNNDKKEKELIEVINFFNILP